VGVLTAIAMMSTNVKPALADNYPQDPQGSYQGSGQYSQQSGWQNDPRGGRDYGRRSGGRGDQRGSCNNAYGDSRQRQSRANGNWDQGRQGWQNQRGRQNRQGWQNQQGWQGRSRHWFGRKYDQNNQSNPNNQYDQNGRDSQSGDGGDQWQRRR
jgi:hypothetical protein